jgi:hypothetical protein
MSVLLTDAQIERFVPDWLAAPSADKVALATAVNTQAAALLGYPAPSEVTAPTLAETTYTHRTHIGDALLTRRAFGVLELPVGPVVSITSISNDGVAVTTGYTLVKTARQIVWDDVDANAWATGFGKITVVYVAGYDAPGAENVALYEYLGLWARHLASLWGRQGRESVSVAGFSGSYDVRQVPTEIRELALSAGLFLPRGLRRLRHALSLQPQPPAIPSPVLEVA